MKVIEIIGKSNSGKTLLIEKLIQCLSGRNFKVGGIKKSFHHDVEYDKEGKDTFRMEKSGALITGGFSKNSAFIYYKSPQHPFDFIKHFWNLDFLLIEGEMNLAVPKIYCLSEGSEAPHDPLLFTLFSLEKISNKGEEGKKIYTLTEIAELCDFAVEHTPPFLPQLNCGKCGYSCSGLLEKILKEEANVTDCKVLCGTKCKVFIDNTPIELMPFLDEMLRNIIKGFLLPLKGYREGKIRIEIEE